LFPNAFVFSCGAGIFLRARSLTDVATKKKRKHSETTAACGSGPSLDNTCRMTIGSEVYSGNAEREPCDDVSKVRWEGQVPSTEGVAQQSSAEHASSTEAPAEKRSRSIATKSSAPEEESAAEEIGSR